MLDDLLRGALAAEPRALGRVLTAVEDGRPEGRELLARLHPRTGRARTVGLTGPPGVGKSSLTDRLTTLYRRHGQRVAIVAVDPTSPFSGGAILGDRIRMGEHFTDPGVFIRSMATRGSLGGLAAATADVVDVLDAAGFDLVVVETIGVGQEDVEVARVVETCLVVMTPGLGDEVQVMKSGIMEIGDAYVVNKADLPGADRIVGALEAALSIAGLLERRPIVRTVATASEGIEELKRAIDASASGLDPQEAAARRQARARNRVDRIVRDRLARLVRSEVASEALWEKQAAAVARREVDPYAAARAILAAAGLDEGGAASPSTGG